jgi:hypothetical protein
MLNPVYQTQPDRIDLVAGLCHQIKQRLQSQPAPPKVEVET